MSREPAATPARRVRRAVADGRPPRAEPPVPSGPPCDHGLMATLDKTRPPPIWLPNGEFINAREDPDHAIYRGIDAIRSQNQDWFDSYPDLHLEPLEIRANGDRVFVWVRFTGHGAESGAAMEMELAHVATFEGGKLRRVQEYSDRAEALAAVGIAA
jgi:ketosteroid isomerase-like protein